MVKKYLLPNKEGKKEVFYLRKERNVLFNDALNTFLFTVIWQLAARVLLYASSHRQDTTYHGLCYTSHGALAVLFKDALSTFFIYSYMALDI